jgi:hypothetical protein
MLLEAAHTSDQPLIRDGLVQVDCGGKQSPQARSVPNQPAGDYRQVNAFSLARWFGPVLKYRAGLAVRLWRAQQFGWPSSWRLNVLTKFPLKGTSLVIKPPSE